MLLEGGPHLAGAFLDAGEIDELRLFIAPCSSAARAMPATRSRAWASSASARRSRATGLECDRIGEDVLLSARLAEW